MQAGVSPDVSPYFVGFTGIMVAATRRSKRQARISFLIRIISQLVCFFRMRLPICQVRVAPLRFPDFQTDKYMFITNYNRRLRRYCPLFKQMAQPYRG